MCGFVKPKEQSNGRIWIQMKVLYQISMTWKTTDIISLIIWHLSVKKNQLELSRLLKSHSVKYLSVTEDTCSVLTTER